MYEHLLQIQRELAKKVVLKPLENPIKIVAGIDISVEKHTNFGYCATVVLDENLNTIEEKSHTEKVQMPYIPGLLSFRELPLIEKCFGKIKSKPDLVFIDGQGIAHPRNFGIASHFGVVFNIPTIGCAKSLLVGEYSEPDTPKGSFTQLIYKNSIVGAVLRTKTDTKPIFVSPGNLITLEQAIKITMKYTGKYRIPEPTRRADILSKKLRREKNENDLLV